MPNVTKDATKIINETDYATLTTGASTTLANCLPIDLTKATSLVLMVKGTTVPGTITLTLYASVDDADDASYGTAPWNPNTVWATGWTHTTTVLLQHSPEIPVGPKYLKVMATNDAGTSVEGLQVWAIVQTLG